jgi:hypothetical protein
LLIWTYWSFISFTGSRLEYLENLLYLDSLNYF